MTNEKAYKITQKSLEEGIMIPEAFGYGYLYAVEEALEKQIPKKPQDCNGERMCKCGNIVKSYQKYCVECGQAIDWSEEE